MKDDKEKSLADRLHDGNMAHAVIEDRVDEIFPDLVCKIGSDYYDNSLEVYFSPETPADFVATQEQSDKIFEMGFSRFWLNFTDSTEQAVSRGSIGERHTVSHVKWTEKKAKEYL
jgi:hypothetical protein